MQLGREPGFGQQSVLPKAAGKRGPRFEGERDFAGDAVRQAAHDGVPQPVVEDFDRDALDQDQRRYQDQDGAAEQRARQHPFDQPAQLAALAGREFAAPDRRGLSRA